MKNTTNAVRTISEVGIFAALGFVFDELQGIIFKGVFPKASHHHIFDGLQFVY